MFKVLNEYYRKQEQATEEDHSPEAARRFLKEVRSHSRRKGKTIPLPQWVQEHLRNEARQIVGVRERRPFVGV
jgi:hypothetical protein